MADPDAEEIEDCTSSNYYSVLNIPKDASSADIRAAYRKMCVMYHPDKHSDEKHKQTAESTFAKIHKAYEVLSNEQSRIIYDIYGQKGLDAEWNIIERKRTHEEIREEYERLKHEAEERRIQQKTNPVGSFALEVDATGIFSSVNPDYADDPYYQDVTWSGPSVNKMVIYQAIEAPITREDTAILSGSMVTTGGKGNGSVDVNYRRVLSTQSWGEANIGVGNGLKFGLKGSRNLGKHMSGTISINPVLKEAHLSYGLGAMIARKLTKNTTGYLIWSGNEKALTSRILRKTESYNLAAYVQISVPNSHCRVAYTHKFGTETKAKVALRFGFAGLMLEYGCDHKVTSLSRLGAFMSIGQFTGVHLKIIVHRHTQTFNFPIILSEFFDPAAIFYGTVTPVLTYFTVKALLVVPMLRERRERELKEKRERNAKIIAQRKKEAEECIEMMRDSYKRSLEDESQKHGLIITEAWYGKFISSGSTTTALPTIFNVTIPLQCLVKESKLIITDATKSDLSGFYDPCIGEEKTLKVTYEFRDAVHEVTYKDDEPIRIPKQSHRISSKVS